MPRQIFVNLPIKDLQKTMAFFSSLGFTFNPQFTDDKAACMIIGENIFAMLLREEFFGTFIGDKKIADAKTMTEALLAVTVENREAVDATMQKGIAAGGKEIREPQDHGWMYSRSLEDLDGHIWEIFFADESQIPKE